MSSPTCVAVFSLRFKMRTTILQDTKICSSAAWFSRNPANVQKCSKHIRATPPHIDQRSRTHFSRTQPHCQQSIALAVECTEGINDARDNAKEAGIMSEPDQKSTPNLHTTTRSTNFKNPIRRCSEAGSHQALFERSPLYG